MTPAAAAAATPMRSCAATAVSRSELVEHDRAEPGNDQIHRAAKSGDGRLPFDVARAPREPAQEDERGSACHADKRAAQQRCAPGVRGPADEQQRRRRGRAEHPLKAQDEREVAR